MTSDTYLRYPHVCGDTVVFVADDDVWTVSASGGRAYRVTSDHTPARSPRISPDGTQVAWTAVHGQTQEAYVAPLDGGAPSRLTYWGRAGTTVRGWLSDDEVLVVSSAGEAGRDRTFVHAVPADGGPSRRLPLGWVGDLAVAPGGLGAGALLSSSTMSEPAWWKHYRGGTAAQLWWDGSGGGQFVRIFESLESGLVCPLWTTVDDGERIGFLSDHEGRGQLYSTPVEDGGPQADALTRHTDHELYARHASSDGRQVVYVSGGQLHLLESLDPGTEARPVDVRLTGARAGLRPQHVEVNAKTLQTIGTDREAKGSALEARGRIMWLPHRDGPARALADDSTARRRLPTVLGDTGDVAWVTDADGDDAIEIGSAGGGERRILVEAGRVGRVLELTAAPDGRRLAIATHDGRVLVTETTGRVVPVQVDSTTMGDMSGLAFSPDSRWLAWSAPGVEPLRHIRMVEVGRNGRAGATPFDVTPLRFTDTEPVFTADGLHLSFLSVRSLDPVYDAVVFDLSFPGGCRPMLVPLAADTASPFDPLVGGRPVPGGKGPDDTAPKDEDSADSDKDAPDPVRVDVEGLDQRIIPVPVPAARYAELQAVEGALVWLRKPLNGELGDDRAHVGDEAARATLERLDLTTGKLDVLTEAADGVRATGNGKHLLVTDQDRLRLLPSDHKVEDKAPDNVTVDLSRIRIQVNPREEWTQMLHEAWRLMRDHYWRADMGGTDWEAARDRYTPLLGHIATHDDLVDLIWELHGELGTSHAYCMPAPAPPTPGTGQGLLGADLRYVDGRWRIDRIVSGESSEPRARSPLFAPGVGAREGDAVVAVDGRPTSRTRPPEALLLGSAGKPVELTIEPADGGAARAVAVVPLGTDLPLRYQDWANDRRRYVHDRTDGKIGYLHIPDMVSGGWAQLHRDLRTEVGRDGLIVDVRGNSGGHTSQLVIEKLTRRVLGWDTARHWHPTSYPGDARRGPMVAIADMFAGSDGDIVTAAIQSLELGPVIGTRTWGGVVGIDGRYSLVDGTTVTQPRFSFWFEKFGWGVENHGVDPDIEVQVPPQDRAAGRDVQLDRALQEVQALLEQTPALNPPPLPPLA